MKMIHAMDAVVNQHGMARKLVTSANHQNQKKCLSSKLQLREGSSDNLNSTDLALKKNE